jgi:hypothetical protein
VFIAKDVEEGFEFTKPRTMNLESLHKTRPNSLWMRLFVDAKADEIVQIFSGGPRLEINKMVNSLSNFSPSNANNWSKMKF